ncbi:hypothetical protein QWZ13_04675 [Reinekea marina]|uniref:hypothetical protein n=1 Tax=Reinekea marina TaxID=1310421 RepID=UPI0025B2C7D9|nr:hypothetical protein [Reinekea marina]MDN3648200.1 hypothetical protein [Reinekea marina]
MRVSSCKLQAASCKLQAASCKLQAASQDCRWLSFWNAMEGRCLGVKIAAGCGFGAAGKTLKHSRLRFALNAPTFLVWGWARFCGDSSLIGNLSQKGEVYRCMDARTATAQR